MLIGGLQVDFMPDDENVLGFSNRWYKSAMETSTYHDLTPEIRIKLVTPVFFVATKLEAFNGRGNGDALSSRDIEDIVNLVDGRAELVDEIIAAEKDVKEYIAPEIIKLLSNPDFESAVSSQAKGDHDRQNILFERLETISEQTQ